MKPLIPLRTIVDLNLASRTAKHNIDVATEGYETLREMRLRDLYKKEAAVLSALEALRETYEQLAHFADEATHEENLNDLLAEAGIQ